MSICFSFGCNGLFVAGLVVVVPCLVGNFVQFKQWNVSGVLRFNHGECACVGLVGLIDYYLEIGLVITYGGNRLCCVVTRYKVHWFIWKYWRSWVVVSGRSIVSWYQHVRERICLKICGLESGWQAMEDRTCMRFLWCCWNYNWVIHYLFPGRFFNNLRLFGGGLISSSYCECLEFYLIHFKGATMGINANTLCSDTELFIWSNYKVLI